MSDEYILTAQQQKAWTALLDEKAPRGARTAMAKHIAQTERKADPASWKTTITGFFKGQAKELRAIFTHAKRLRAAEVGLGVSAGELRAWLDHMRSGSTQDAPLDVRLAGFEDYGPVAVTEAYFAPLVGESTVWLPPSGSEDTSPSALAGGALNIEKIVAEAKRHGHAHPFAIVFCAAPGTGKTTTLRLLTGRLQSAGVVVNKWKPGLGVQAGVIVCDDLDLLNSSERSLLCKTIQERSCVLVTATSATDALADFPKYRAVYKLQLGNEQWSVGYVNHLEQLLQRLGHNLKLDALRSWIESDLFGPALTNRIDNIGLLARHVAEGGTMPPRYHDLAGWAVSRAVSRVRSHGNSRAALLIAEYGQRVLEDLVAAACRSNSQQVPMRTLLTALQQALAGTARKPADISKELLEPTAFIEAADELCQRGLFHRHADRVIPAQPACGVSALGRALTRDGIDRSLLEHTILSPDYADALISAAEHLEDGDLILREIFALPGGVFSQAVPALTRFIAAPVPFRDVQLYTRAFLFCLSVWARWPADKRAITLLIGGPRDAAPPAINHERLVGTHPPLIVLALASRLHRKLLPTSIAPDEIAQGLHLTEDFREYMNLIGPTSITADQARYAVGLGAPFQSDILLDPDFWHQFQQPKQVEGEIPGGLKAEDFSLWWRHAGALRLLEFPDGNERVAGTHADHSIEPAMLQTPVGGLIWKQAMVSQIKQRHSRALTVYAEAVLFALTRGGSWNVNTVRAVWEEVPGERESLRRSIFASLLASGLIPWSNDLILPWLLSCVVVGEDREALWLSWTKCDPGNVGWKKFLEAGLPLLHIARWALDAHKVDTGSAQKTSFPWSNGGFSTNAASALDALVASNDLNVLEFLLRSEEPTYARKALAQLSILTSESARKRRLELAVEFRSEARLWLVRELQPQPHEADAWQRIAVTELSPFLSVSLAGLYALVSSCDKPWQPVIEALEFAAAIILDKPGWVKSLMERFERLGVPVPEESVLRSIRTNSRRELQTRLADLARVVVTAVQQEQPEPRPLLLKLLDCESVRLLILAGSHAPLWQVALRSLGRERIIRYLLKDHAELVPIDGTKSRLTAFTESTPEQVEFVHSLLSHPELGPPASRALALTAYRKKPALLRAALVQQERLYLIEPKPTWSSSVAPLLDEYISCAPDSALAWLTMALHSVPTGARRALWGEVLPKLKPGPHRALGFAQYLRP